MSEPTKTRLDDDTADSESLTSSPDLAELTNCIAPSDDSISNLADCIDSPPHARTSSRDIPAAEQNMAMFCHLAPLSGCVIPLGSLILWLAKKDSMLYVDQEGKKAINFQISVLIYILVSAVLCMVVIGFLFLFVVAIFHLVMVVSNGIKAGKGQETRYPLSIPFIK